MALLTRADRQQKPKRRLAPYEPIHYAPPDDLAMWPRRPDPDGPLTLKIGRHNETGVYVNHPHVVKNFDTIVDLSGGAHLAVVGATGSGKTHTTINILSQLRANGCELVIIDPSPKACGDFTALAHTSYQAAHPENIENMLLGLEALFERRNAQRHGTNGPWDLAMGPQIVVCIEELPSLYTCGINPRALKVVEDLVRLSRSTGFTLLFLAQRLTLDTDVPGMIRANLGTRLLLSTTDPTARRVVIGDVPAWEKEPEWAHMWDPAAWNVNERRFILRGANASFAVCGKLDHLSDTDLRFRCMELSPRAHIPELEFDHVDRPSSIQDRIMACMWRYYPPRDLDADGEPDSMDETAVVGHLRVLLGYTTEQITHALYELTVDGKLVRNGSKWRLPGDAPKTPVKKSDSVVRMEANAALNQRWDSIDTRPGEHFYLAIRGAMLDGCTGVSALMGWSLSPITCRIVGLPEGTTLPKNKNALNTALKHLVDQKLISQVGQKYVLAPSPITVAMVQTHPEGA